MVFQDRTDAGRRLAQKLMPFQGASTIVLALPRGGVVVGYEVAQALRAPLDVIITHKIPAPGNPEYAIGAVAENGEAQLNHAEIRALGISQGYIERETRAQLEEIGRRKQLYRGDRPLPSLKGRTVIIVDDGVATGYTMMAAIKAVKAEQPGKVIVAVPVGPAETVDELAEMADEVVVISTPVPFFAVGAFYRSFEQTPDADVQMILERARRQSLGA